VSRRRPLAPARRPVDGWATAQAADHGAYRRDERPEENVAGTVKVGGQETPLAQSDSVDSRAERNPPFSTSSSFAFEPLDDLETCRSEWVGLAERSGNIFSTWEWADSWWRYFGRGRSLRLLAARRPDRSTAAIVPLYEASRRPLRVGRLLGHGVADLLGPVAGPDERSAATGALASAGETALLDLVVAERLTTRDVSGGSMRPCVVRRESSPALPTEGMSWDEFLATRSSNFRQQVRRRERRMKREFGLTLSLTETEASLERDFATLLDLHAARWGRASSAFSPTRRAFHREFAFRAFRQGWLRLWTAYANDRPVASWYGFRFGGAEWYYQGGRDPAWEHEAVGFVLMAHTLREAFTDGMREYRLLLGAEAYKERFASEDQEVETLILPASGGGHRVVRPITTASQHAPTATRKVVGRLLDRGTRR